MSENDQYSDIRELRIMGARTELGQGRTAMTHKLVALDKETLQPVSVDWWYEDESAPCHTGSVFTDTRPSVRLMANSDTYRYGDVINISNVGGSNAALAVIQNDGTVVAWGMPQNGGSSPSSDRNHNVKSIYGGYDCSAAVNADGQVFTWSVDSDNTLPPEIAQLNDIIDIKVAQYWDDKGNNTYLALRANKQVAQWTDGTSHDDFPTDIAERKDFVAIQVTEYAFAGITENGHILTWGNESYGGALPDHLKDINDTVTLYSNDGAFVALRSSGTIVSWGSAEHGGDMPDDIASLTDIVSICNTSSTFIALRANGSVVFWGSQRTLSVLPENIASLTNIIDVQGAINGTYAFLTADGKVYCWGRYDEHFPEGLDNVVSLTAAWNAFAALRRDGSVIAWGNRLEGGDTTPVADELYNIRAIYSCGYRFLALRDDDFAFEWGEEAREDITKMPASLQGNIIYSFVK
ncbi:RCC1 domain-containing protein [Enterobacter cancerogenus]|uniref:Cell division protein FtsQ n=1 Tax=Enterobacter cancerogenus TaxID=69218 RepID=A0A484WUV7_9ENTR|nr:cell division protein FtsQ [Enterobacter cancerogenus]